MEIFFYNLWKNLKNIFSLQILPWHIAAVVLTYLILALGFDWRWFMLWDGSSVQGVMFSAVALGGIVPIVTPFILFTLAKIRHSSHLLVAAGASGQAAMLGWFVSALYKVFTGRVPPPLRSIGTLVDSSHGFQFGLWRGGIFWGWPSSHTTVAFAVSVALCVLYKKSKALTLIFLLYALFVGIGVSMSIHWFSEFAAGIIFGTIVGVVVGRTFSTHETITVEN